MIVQILCILAALMLALPASAKVLMPTATEIAKGFPPEMMWEGKPISPACIEASYPSMDEIVPQDLKICSQPPGEGPQPSELRADSDGSLRYDYTCPQNKAGNEYCGSYSYRYLGKVEDGFALLTTSRPDDQISYTSILVMSRDSDTITMKPLQSFGDACERGIHDARVKDGKVEYEFYVTAAALYQQFKPDGGTFNGYRVDSKDCMAIAHAEGQQVMKYELARGEPLLAKDQPCAADAFRAQEKEGVTLTADQMREFIAKVEKACAK